MGKGYDAAAVWALVCIITCSTAAAAQNDDVSKWCAKTEKPSECSLIVHHNPEHTPLNRFPSDMGIVLLNTAIQKGNAVTQFIVDSLGSGAATESSDLKWAFQRCTSPFSQEDINFQIGIKRLASDPNSRWQIAQWLRDVQIVVVDRCKSYHPNPVPSVFATLVSKVDDYVTLLKITQQLLKAN